MVSNRVDVGGIGLNSALGGQVDAPVVCLNPCFASDLRYWDVHLPAYVGFRVLRHDARGHSKSGNPSGPYSLLQMADDLVGLLDYLRIH